MTIAAQKDVHFQTLIATTMDGVIVADHRGRIQVYNPACERMFGYSVDEVVGRNVKILMPSRYRARHDGYETRNDITEGERIFGAGREVVGLRKDGSTFPICLSVGRGTSEGREVYVGIIHDLSERERWEGRLVERERRLRSLLSASLGMRSISSLPADCPISTDEQILAERKLRLIVEVGEVLATTLEFEDTLTNIARLVVANLADLCILNFVDDDGVARRARVFCRDRAKRWVCDALMHMPPGREQVRIAQAVLETRRSCLIADVTPDLLRSWAVSDEHFVALQAIGPKSAIIAPLLVHGKLLGALSLMSSDASRRYGPEDLRVAEAVAGRSAFFLENARNYREAKQATKARDDMFRVVAHDLRNPLTIIQALAGALRRSGKECEAADAILDATQRMSRLIQDLIDVTRLQAGSLPLNPERLTVSEITSETQASQQTLASAASLEIGLEEEPDLPPIWADHDRIRQVFENLIGNAVKFTKPGGRIKLGASARPGEILFSVADTGRGIPSDQLPHVFDLFWQSQGSDAKRGAGLGLPIVKGIVEAHGGRVWVESSPDQGTTFYFTVPAAPEHPWQVPIAEYASSHANSSPV